MSKSKQKQHKSRPILFIIFFIVILIAATYFIFEEPINRQLQFFMKNYNCEYKNADLSDLPVKASDDNAWYNDHHIIAHAMGGIDDIVYTNSQDAFLHNYEKGYKLFEGDIIFTIDGVPMLFHERTERSIQSEAQKGFVHSDWFTENKDPFGFTDLTLDDILEYMVEYSDIYFITDVKDYFLDRPYTVDEYKMMQADFNRQVAQYIYDWAVDHQQEDILDRIIIQLYSEECYEKIHSISPSFNYIYTLYLFNYESGVNHFEISKFCVENNISAVVMPYSWATASIMDVYAHSNLPVYVHAVNDVQLLKNLYRIGVDGVFSSFISPQENLEVYEKYRHRGYIYRL